MSQTSALAKVDSVDDLTVFNRLRDIAHWSAGRKTLSSLD